MNNSKNNSKNSASPTTSTDSQTVKPKNSSYWLTPEEIEELHRDAIESLERMRALRLERKKQAMVKK